MYSVSVRDHFMIAHSFAGEIFGPAQRLHGATFVVDLEFRRGDLGEAARGVESVRVTLHESHVASASYEAAVS